MHFARIKKIKIKSVSYHKEAAIYVADKWDNLF
jgi:hypothetical protein